MDVRYDAASRIDLKLNLYEAAVRSEFEVIVENDPDHMGRLASWIHQLRKPDEKRKKDPWISFLAGIPIVPQEKQSDITDQDLRIYFGLGKENYFEPDRARKHNKRIALEKNIQVLRDTIRSLREFEIKGELTDVQFALAKQRLDISDTAYWEAEYSVQSIGKMLGQLWRLKQEEIVQAVSSVVINPERFSSDEWNLDETVCLGLLASTFIKEPPAQKIILDQVLQQAKWRNNPKVVTSAARACYSFSIDYIVKAVIPLLRNQRSYYQKPSQCVATSLCYAIARDVDGANLPQPTPRELPFFGF